MPPLICDYAHDLDSDSQNTRMTATDNTRKETRFCPYCGMSSFELSGEEGEFVYCEYCGIDVGVRELIP